jgi:hypothetical protein
VFFEGRGGKKGESFLGFSSEIHFVFFFFFTPKNHCFCSHLLMGNQPAKSVPSGRKQKVSNTHNKADDPPKVLVGRKIACSEFFFWLN